MDIILKYFPDLSALQRDRIARLELLYNFWNQKINIISRKDIGSLYEKHVLHSMAIAKIVNFRPGTRILDVGTGGGFPGLPLAILFPECNFHLIDSTGKKINVVLNIARDLLLDNVFAEHIRAEQLQGNYDFIVARAVTALPEFYAWTHKNISALQQNAFPNGIFYLKGGDLEEEIKPFKNRLSLYLLKELFEEDYFKTKKLLFIPV